MNLLNNRLLQELKKREEEGRLRKLSVANQGIDFWSNDYLGFARNMDLQKRILEFVNSHSEVCSGSTGSRLISGNTAFVMDVEDYIARKHRVGSVLLFPSGYVSNLSFFSSIPQKSDCVLLDEKIHRSVIDGCRLSGAKRWKFRHNDLNHLEDLIRRSSGQVWVAVESLYSMDGDFAPLRELVGLCKKYEASLIVDEAHAIGTFGLGLISSYGLMDDVFACIVTYGKAMGQSGAAILGSHELKSYLVNFASPFIYSTGMPDFHAGSIKLSYEFLEENGSYGQALQQNINRFLNEGAKEGKLESPIRPIRFENISDLGKAMELLSENKILSYAVKSPSVAKHEEMIRINLHSFNHPDEINLLKEIINEFKNE
ncbi:aminotransferase class I/II-fold pyridoxal phosphate-dependent enzyme [Sphingobacterium endophyticum]|uniref:aminotransferase class I/II-fold pyridoxal phosphate-dependent enzyme n=1 Tax=Sphingobacterium endophyticum TaxID=2546448 RepID=UPI0012E1994F|nr:pyridoxal phosphate-dependent aminotransferase family protein [Sphingobacterium endophyticum]